MNPLLLSDPRIARTPSHDNGELLVSLLDAHPRLRVDDSAANIACVGYTPVFEARRGVAARLCAAAGSLPDGLALLVKESLRPLALQTFYFNRRQARLAAEFPQLDAEALLAMTAKFVAPPQVAGHPTGGAVDVTLCTAEGAEMDMGCAYDADEVASQGACFSFASGLSPEARRNRDVLFAALNGQGFVNYPFEWWHWGFGDKYWAAVSGAAGAIYAGVVD